MGISQSREERDLRSVLQPPLSGGHAKSAGVIGTLALDADFEANTCGSSAGITSPIWCCCYQGLFRVPWPCTCCGAECVCCPHAPHGIEWESALQSEGWRALLAEAGALAMSVAQQQFTGAAPLHVLRGNARAAAFSQSWTPRANVALAPFSLHVNVFNWIEERRDDKGNKTGEALRCAIQVYRGASYPDTAFLQQQQQQQVLPYQAPEQYLMAPQKHLAPLEGQYQQYEVPRTQMTVGAFFPMPSAPAAVGAPKAL